MERRNEIITEQLEYLRDFVRIFYKREIHLIDLSSHVVRMDKFAKRIKKALP